MAAPASINRVSSLARSHTEGAIKVLAMIMHNDDALPAARVAAANSILDRGWGKPVQTISGDPDNPLSVITRIELIGVKPVLPPPY
jgi:hypothetical protein